MPNLKSEIKKHIPDSIILRYGFKKILGRRLDLKCPKTLNEKLQWLKIYDRKPIYTTMVDKYAVKDYVASIIGEEYIIPTLGVWEEFDDIDFDLLIRRLSKDERLILTLYYKNMYTPTEISKILNINVNTVKSKILRAKQKLQQLYKKGGDINE